MAFYKSLNDRRRYLEGTDAPGKAGWIAARLRRLRDMLDQQITSRRASNSLIIGSWNIQHFDGGRPRLPESFHYIAEIIDHFDICAIQEVKDLEAMERLQGLLGPNWTYFVNDTSGSGRGNHERMAFIYNRNKVSFRNLIGELVIPKGALPGDEQIGRTPFFASFQAGWFRFTLCSAHIVYKEVENRPLREDEIRVIAAELEKRAKDTEEVHVFLGDMNIESRTDAGMRALTENGFEVPDLGPTSLSGDKYYDQIAFTQRQAKTRLLDRGVIRWQDAVFTDCERDDYLDVAAMIRKMKDYYEVEAAMRAPPDARHPYSDWSRSYSGWRADEMSDHLPIWIELRTDYSDEYLDKIIGA